MSSASSRLIFFEPHTFDLNFNDLDTAAALGAITLSNRRHFLFTDLAELSFLFEEACDNSCRSVELFAASQRVLSTLGHHVEQSTISVSTLHNEAFIFENFQGPLDQYH